MSDLLGLGIIALLLICGLFGLAQLTKPYDISTEEFEKRASDGPGLLGAGLIGIQKLLDPAVEKAAAVQEDLRQGRYDGEQGIDDGPEAGNDDRGNT